MRLFLIRHGQTESNRLGLALGRDDVPLNELGRWQSERLAEALRRERLAAIYSSPLVRTLKTARAIAGPHGLDVRIDERLMEMDIGELDGLSFAEMRERYPDLLEAWTGDDGPTMEMPGGESLVAVQERAWSAAQELLAKHPEEEVGAVTHNFVILSLLARVLDVDLAHFRRLRHEVGAISVVDFSGKSAAVVRLNDTSHLRRS